MSPIWCFSVFFRVTILPLCIQLFQDPFWGHLEISTGFLSPKAHILKRCASFCHNNSGSEVAPNTLTFLTWLQGNSPATVVALQILKVRAKQSIMFHKFQGKHIKHSMWFLWISFCLSWGMELSSAIVLSKTFSSLSLTSHPYPPIPSIQHFHILNGDEKLGS